MKKQERNDVGMVMGVMFLVIGIVIALIDNVSFIEIPNFILIFSGFIISGLVISTIFFGLTLRCKHK